MYHGLSNRFGRTRWYPKVTAVHLEIVLILTQDRCTVCAEHTIGPEIALDAPGELQGARLKWMLVSVCLAMVLNLMLDRCTNSAE
jgi:hypothetical protein